MIATILDTVTGAQMVVTGPRTFEWHENNYSCDCNRNPWDNEPRRDDGICEGCHRYLVIKAVVDGPDDYECSLEDLNEGYPPDLLKKHLPTNATT